MVEVVNLVLHRCLLRGEPARLNEDSARYPGSNYSSMLGKHFAPIPHSHCRMGRSRSELLQSRRWVPQGCRDGGESQCRPTPVLVTRRTSRIERVKDRTDFVEGDVEWDQCLPQSAFVTKTGYLNPPAILRGAIATVGGGLITL